MSGDGGGTGQGNCHMGPTSSDTTENITFQQLSWRAVKIALCAIEIAQNGFMHEYLLCLLADVAARTLVRSVRRRRVKVTTPPRSSLCSPLSVSSHSSSSSL